MSQLTDRLLNACFAIATIGITTAIIHREFAKTARPPATAKPSIYVDSWKDLAQVGRSSGNPSARITIIEISDLECPFCRKFNTVEQAILAKYPRDVRRVFIHLPLSFHRFAIPAARAVECAADAGHFDEMVDVIFEKQDSLGLKSWASFASQAGVTDTVALARCAGTSGAVRGLKEGRQVAKILGVTGTPTVLLNGWKFGIPPDENELDQAIQRLLTGKQPYPEYPAAAVPR
jgi:protein-disulfide isomerase